MRSWSRIPKKPRAAGGLRVLVQAITPSQAVLDLGGVPNGPTAVPIRVTIRIGAFLNGLSDALSKAAGASGFLNAAPDPDGLLRRAPLLLEYDGRVYPALALAAVAVTTGSGSAGFIVFLLTGFQNGFCWQTLFQGLMAPQAKSAQEKPAYPVSRLQPRRA